MKKQYIAPNIILVKTEIQTILAGSTLSVADPSKTFDGATALSKDHKLTNESLWDESWEDEEEE